MKERVIGGIKFYDDHTLPDGSGFLSVKIYPYSVERRNQFTQIVGMVIGYDIELIEDSQLGTPDVYAILHYGVDKSRYLNKSEMEGVREILRSLPEMGGTLEGFLQDW